jgi:hypothetical protein
MEYPKKNRVILTSHEYLPMGVVAVYFVDFFMVVEMLSGSYRMHQFLNCSFFIFIAASLSFYRVRAQRSRWE